MFLVVGEWKAAFWLGNFSAFGVWASYKLNFPARLAERVAERVAMMQLPSSGGSDQVMQCLWAFARGGWFGQGVGHLTLLNLGKNWRPAIPLATTDGPVAVLGETVGTVGTLAVLALFILLALWLLRQARRAQSVLWRLWLWGVFVYLTATTLWALLWPLGCLPPAGLAVPILSRGHGPGWFWGSLLAVSFAGAQRLGSSSLVGSYCLHRLQRSTAACLWGLVILLIPLTFKFSVNLLHYAVLGREGILTEPFLNREQEDLCRQAVRAGLITVRDGTLVVDETKRLPSPFRFKRWEDELKWARRSIARGCYQIRTTAPGCLTIRLNPYAFITNEPSGLGSTLLAARREVR